ncbi:ABC transporter transmembrane domain-containing protein [Pseudarthrobacter sp. J1763]|uniref:ABC transporter transmembrane domain-containing protein n=1 Tax=Pseudarthrobacter sp. J1763 TaxID=3420445 RepID=UPI003D2B23E6
MRAYPYTTKTPADLRSPRHYLTWLGTLQLSTLVGGLLYGILWMMAQALSPLVIGKAIDAGIVGHNMDALWFWGAVLLGLALLQAVTATLRHRMAVSNFLQAMLRTNQLIGKKVAHSGEALTRTLATGEIVTAASYDAARIGQLFDITARLTGSIVAYLAVSAMVAAIHGPLGLTVLIGVPLLGALLTFVVKPLQKRQAAQREATGKMSAVGADTVAGLRVLRGIGGERIFVDRYRQRSQLSRLEGNRVASSVATLDAAQLLIAGVFSVFFTWIGAGLAVEQQITAGELISLYGFAAFLVSPIRVGSEAINAVIRGMVGSRKVIGILGTKDLVSDGDAAAPIAGSVLRDGASGVELHPGALTALVCADPGLSAAVAKRMGRFDDAESAEVRWGAVPITELPLAAVRSRIAFSPAEPQLFTGPLRHGLDPHGKHQDQAIWEAIELASGADILDAIDGGLDHEVDERGRSFSGGQRQRLALARAVLTEAEVLLLVEPSSAVDAHTEQRIAKGLAEARGGAAQPQHSTLVVTASPLMLGVMDHVIFMPRTGAPVMGSHSELMATQAEYHTVVVRSE